MRINKKKTQPGSVILKGLEKYRVLEGGVDIHKHDKTKDRGKQLVS